MSADSLYAKYLLGLTENFSQEIQGSVAHRDAIDRFGLVAEKFGITPSICVHRGIVLSLSAVYMGNDHESKISEMDQAGYEVGDPVHDSFMSSISQGWEVPVSGHEITFKLFFTTRKAHP